MKLAAIAVLLFTPFAFADLPSTTIPDCLGVNIHFTDPRPGEMEMLAAGGFKWVRMDFHWARIEAARGQYDFAPYDRLLAALDAHQMHAVLILDYSNPLYDNDESPHSDEAVTAFAKWAAASVSHFKKRGVIWEMYNEPNIQFWRPRPDVQQYIKLALATGKAIKSTAPDEQHIGPALSGLDPTFIEACFRAGLLAYWDAVSVHPYAQDAPETRTNAYRDLRTMIEKYKPPGKTIPVISGEWGYSSTWPGCNPELQGKFLAREYLFNIAQEIPLSIWYDWHDDGPDPKEPEHHFGTTLHPTIKGRDPIYDAKPAYVAARTLTTELKGFGFNKRLSLESPEDWLLIFCDKNAMLKLAAWTTSRTPRKVRLPLGAAKFDVLDYLGRAQPQIVSVEAQPEVTLTDAPIYLTPTEHTEPIHRAWRWDRAPLEITARGPATVDIPLTAQDDNANPIKVTAQVAITREPAPVRARMSLGLPETDGIAQETTIVVSNPLIVTLMPPTEHNPLVRIENPAGESDTLLVRRAESNDAGASLKFAEKQTSAIVELAGDPAAGVEVVSGDGKRVLATAPPVKFALVSSNSAHYSLVAEGDAHIGSTQQLSDVAAPDGAPVKLSACFRIDYTFNEGWKYIRLAPRKENQKIDGRPDAVCFWLKGDASGNVPRMRFVDASGQTFQPTGEAMRDNDWRFVRFPLDASSAHWGGASDGVVHYPIRLDTLLLIDSADRRASHGAVYIASPALIYPK